MAAQIGFGGFDPVGVSHMANGVNRIKREVTRLIEPIVDEMDLELVDMEYLSEHGRWVLRIFVDKPGGIMLEDCARLSREIGDVMDAKDILQHQYVLEVSSPGLNRRLRRDKDFMGALGEKIKVKMGTPVEGRRNFTGYLREFRDGALSLAVGNALISLPVKDVERANLVYEFEK